MAAFSARKRHAVFCRGESHLGADVQPPSRVGLSNRCAESEFETERGPFDRWRIVAGVESPCHC